MKALHALKDAVIGDEEAEARAEKRMLLDPNAEPSRTLERPRVCSILSLPPPVCKTKRQTLRLRSTQMPRGNAELLLDYLCCAEQCCFCI